MAKVLTIEQPDTEAIIEFLGPYGCTITAKLEKNNKTGDFDLYVIAVADDDRKTILGEILAEHAENAFDNRSGDWWIVPIQRVG